MITRAVVVPQAPLLVPELVPGVVEQTAALRTACRTACAALADTSGRWIAVGADPVTGEFGPQERGSFGGYGADVEVTLSVDAAVDADLPLPALIAGWLRERAGAASVRVRLLDPACPVADCAAVAAELDDGPVTGLLVLGDGSFRHGPKAPGGEDERAGAFDTEVARALGAGDSAALLGVDPGLATELGAVGRAPWQVLASLGGEWRAELLHTGAPFGVGYHVAVWDRAVWDRA